MNRRTGTRILAGVMALSLAGCGASKSEDPQPLAAGTVSGVAVQVASVSATDIATDHQVTGRVIAENSSVIMVAVAARCTRTYFEAGDTVRQGDILCKLDLGSTLSQYSAAQISYESAVQSYNDQAGILDQQIAVARGQVEVLDEQIAVTQEQIAASEEQIRASEEALQASEEALKANEEQIAASEGQITASEEQIRAAEEQIAAAEAQIPVLEQQIAVTQQQAPLTEEQIGVAEQNASVSEQQAALAEKNLEDTKALFAIGAASQLEVDQAQVAVRQARMGADQAQMSANQAALGREQSDLQLNQLRAQLTQSQAQITQSKAQITQSKAQLDSSRAQITASKAQLEQSKAQLNSSRAQITASKAQLEQARSQLSQLRLQRDQAQMAVAQAESGRNSTLSQLAAGIENARSSVQQLDTVLEDVDADGNVIAPIGGILTTFSAAENNLINTTQPLAIIEEAGKMKIVASVSEALMLKLSVGDTADVHISALDGKHPESAYLTTTVSAVERAANAQTRLYTVTLSLPDNADLASGLSADVTFHTDKVENAVVVPSEAILTSGSTEYVFTVSGNTARYVEVATGLTGAGITEILSGLSGGEQLVTVGQSYLHDGDSVRIVGGAT